MSETQKTSSTSQNNYSIEESKNKYFNAYKYISINKNNPHFEI